MAKKPEEAEEVAQTVQPALAENEGGKESKTVEPTETGRVSQSQIDGWKKEHKAGYIKQIVTIVGGNENDLGYVYVKEPNRDVISIALSVPKDSANRATRALAIGTAVLNNCLVGGDERINTDNAYFNSVAAECSAMVTFYETTSKNL